MEQVFESGKNVPVRARVDVLVAGGGVTGVMAAVSAARSGAKTVLAERASFLGSVATMGLPLQGFCDRDGNQAVFGLADEFRRRLVEVGGATGFIACRMHNPYVVVDPEKVKLVCQRMALEAGVELLLCSSVAGVDVDDGKISTVYIEGKSGREAIIAKQYIDCTGDADLVARSGGMFRLADKSALQAITLNVRLAGVDIRAIQKEMRDNPEANSLYPLLSREQLINDDRYIMVGLSEYVKKAASDGEINGLWGNVCYITLVNDGDVCLNSVHISGLNPCDTKDLTQIETEGREQAWQVARFMKMYVPGFENSFVTGTGPWAGIRESRIIDGLCTLTEEDVHSGRVTDDAIALGCYPIDFHAKGSADGSDIDASENKDGLKFEKVPVYGIPYGCLVPKNTRNLLVAGRAISATRTAMSSSRVMAQCMAEGEAAGVAAAMCAAIGVSPSEIDVAMLREKLAEQGARVSQQ